MAKGFHVEETIGAPADEVWAYLTDFRRAGAWMPGVEDMTQLDPGPLGVGTRFGFAARGKARETHVTAYEPGRLIALTSTQGGVTATYTYTLESAGGGTKVALDAVCEAAGLWKVLHPLILVAMRKSDSAQLANLKLAIEREAAPPPRGTGETR